MSLQDILVAVSLMGLAFMLAWSLEHGHRVDRIHTTALLEQVLTLEGEVRRLEVRQAALPECFPYAPRDP